MGVKMEIESLANRQSAEKDGVTDETIKQNKLWITPIIGILLRNCKISQAIPKRWIKGVVTFIHKNEKM